MLTCGSEGGVAPSFISRAATQSCTFLPSAGKSCDWGSDSSTHWSKNVYMLASPQPNDVRSRRAAVMIMRLGDCKTGMNTPEKHAETTTTVMRSLQDCSTIWAMVRGD